MTKVTTRGIRTASPRKATFTAAVLDIAISSARSLDPKGSEEECL